MLVSASSFARALWCLAILAPLLVGGHEEHAAGGGAPLLKSAPLPYTIPFTPTPKPVLPSSPNDPKIGLPRTTHLSSLIIQATT